MFERNILLTLLLTALLAACGGSDDGDDTGSNNDDDDNGTPPPATETGVFVDSAVAGIGYRTATQEGVTNADGEFEYVEGETVVFFIGDVELPPVAATGIVTPLDIFDAEDFSDQQVVNLARLLQSLDEDGDPDNGITLADAAHAAGTGLALEFDVATADFAADVGVINLVSNGGGAGTLVSEDDALAHIEQLSILGSWYIVNDEDSIVVTLMADGTYVYIEGTEFVAEDPGGFPGIEYGTYTWDPLTKAITADVDVDTTGLWGLSELTGDETVVHNDGLLVYTDPDGDDSDLTFMRATSDTNPLVGGWELKIPEEDKVIVLTFTETHYAHAEVAPEDDAGTSGPEFGTYTWNAETGEFIPVTLINLNGEWGFSDEPTMMTAAVDGDTLTLSFDGEVGATLARVK